MNSKHSWLLFVRRVDIVVHHFNYALLLFQLLPFLNLHNLLHQQKRLQSVFYLFGHSLS